MMRKGMLAAALVLALAACGEKPGAGRPQAAAASDDRFAYASIAQLQAGMTAGEFTAADLVRYYRTRIETLDHAGPNVRSVLALNPDALADAEALDKERAEKGPRGPLHGVPILLKDNIDSKDPLPTTAGSLALLENFRIEDAPLAARLRAAGVLILGKTNLSEWANIRDGDSSSGWSAVGGLTRNPHALDRSACGSSSGSGAAVAAGFAPAAIGTETDGSIVCPASINGVVGVKPTVGLVSRTGVVPISISQDTAGPMTRSVADAALVLAALAGTDPKDLATAEADARKADYSAALAGASLKGKRLGVLRKLGPAAQPQLDALFAATLKKLEAAGAVLVPIEEEAPLDRIGPAELTVLLTELKAGMADYLAASPAKVPHRTLADLVAFNSAEPRELALFGQSLFVEAEAMKGLDDPAYRKALATSRGLARQTLDGWLQREKLDALIAPTVGPSWAIDVVNGDAYVGGVSTLSAVSGYPHASVPMGLAQGLPVGLSFMGGAWEEAKLLALAAAAEAVLGPAPKPGFAPNVDAVPAVQAAIAPPR